MSKTVFVLGAGFSTLAQLPPQTALIERIFSPTNEGFMSDKVLIKTITRYEEARRNIAKFLLKLFSDKSFEDLASEKLGYNVNELDEHEKEEILEELESDIKFWTEVFEFIKENLSYIPLEDIFTILDKALVSNEHIQGYDTSKIISLREDFSCCIIRLFVSELNEYNYDTQVYIDFVKKILETRYSNGQAGDEVSILSLNWDALLDSYFQKVISSDENYTDAKLDYCIYDHEYRYYCETSEGDKPIPSTLLKKLEYYNIKYLKLHGAMNWLICKNCRRLFYSQEEYIALKEFEKNSPECPFCKSNYEFPANKEYQINLKSELITPTLLKNLDNVVFKNLWKNAFVELSEADKVVFIGYSLPQADFELRYMLKKAIRPNTKIEVVLYYNDDPDKFSKYFTDKEGETLFYSLRNHFPESRYKSLFGNENITFYYEGLQSFVEKM